MHCCPPLTKCDLVRHRCFKESDPSIVLPWLKRPEIHQSQPEKSLKMDVSSTINVRTKVISLISKNFEKTILKSQNRNSKEKVDVVTLTCPDGNMCNDSETCCQLEDGSYGCCPYHDVSSF